MMKMNFSKRYSKEEMKKKRKNVDICYRSGIALETGHVQHLRAFLCQRRRSKFAQL